MRKGISPIVSSILLLAVALSAASIFSGWGPELVRDATERTSNQTQGTLNCNEGGIEIISGKYNSGDSNTSVVVRNSGKLDLDSLKVAAWEDNLPMNQTSFSLKSGNITTETVWTTSEPTSIRVYSGKCSSLTDRYEEIK